MSERRVAMAAGIAGVLLLLIGQALVLNAPAIDKPASEIRSWAVDHRTQALVACYLLTLGLSVQILFWAGLWRELRISSRGETLLADAGLAALVFLTAVLIAGFGFIAVLAFRAAGMSDEAARTLNDSSFVSLNLSSIATAVTMTLFAGAILRSGVLPTWTAWLALLTAAVHLVAGGAFAHSGLLSPEGIGVYVAPILYDIWIVVVSVVLLRGAGITAPSSVGAAPAVGGR